MTAPPCTALAVSIGCVTIEEACAWTFTVCRSDASFSVTCTSRTELTTTATLELAGSKPLARTVSS